MKGIAIMIWHIFKKDWTLLWPFALIAGSIHALLNGRMLIAGRFSTMPLYGSLTGSVFADYRDLTTGSLPMLALLVSAFLIAAIVHQDAIPGVKQDWLVRPISRWDLLVAKVVAVLVLVQGPIFLADLAEALLDGFSPAQSFAAAFSRFLYLLFSLSLPVLALASVTRNSMEAVAGGAAVVLARSLFTMLPRFQLENFLGYWALGWMDHTIRVAVLLAAACLMLGIQYRYRKTTLARWLMTGAVAVYFLLPPLPPQLAFAVQQRLSTKPGDANGISFTFDPNQEQILGRTIGPINNSNLGDVFVALPVRIDGVPPNAVLDSAWSEVRLTTPDGRIHILARQMGLRAWKEDGGENERPTTYGIRIPTALYRQIADQQVRLEIKYPVTLLRLADTQTMPATGGSQRTAKLGWCGTKLDPSDPQVLFGCIQAGQGPSCASFVLEHRLTGLRNRKQSFCRPNYSPYRYRYGPDALDRFTQTLPFGDVNGNDTYPVKVQMLGDSQVEARVYEAREHTSRQLLIPQILLKDWATD